MKSLVVALVGLAQTSAMAAAARVDLASVTWDQVSALKAEHFWFGCTVEQARHTWADALTPGHMAVTRSAGNGGEPVLTLVSPAFDPGKPFAVQTHFHGDFTAVGAPGGVHTQAIREQLATDPQRVWVLPEAKDHIGQKGTDWSNVMDHAALVREALATVSLELRDDTTLVVSAHSSGGRALATVVENGTLTARQLVLLDCLYEGAQGPGPNTTLLSAVRAGALDAVRDIVIVASGSYPAERDQALLEAARGRARLEPLQPKKGLSKHAAAARNHLVPRTPPRS